MVLFKYSCSVVAWVSYWSESNDSTKDSLLTKEELVNLKGFILWKYYEGKIIKHIKKIYFWAPFLLFSKLILLKHVYKFSRWWFHPNKIWIWTTLYELDEQRVKMNKLFFNFDDFNFIHIKSSPQNRKIDIIAYFLNS